MLCVMLIPPGVDFYEALHPIRQELQKLENGVNVKTITEDGELKTIKVTVAISCLIGDHPQGNEYCRCMSMTANHPCRKCSVRKGNLLMFDPGVVEYDRTRTVLQTDTIQQQMESELKEAKNKEAHKRTIPTKYGINFAKVCAKLLCGVERFPYCSICR